MLMNVLILIFVSLPEAFLNLIIILLFAGKKDCLKISGENVKKFAVTLFLMITTSYIIRPLISNVAANMAIHSVVYMGVIAAVYRQNIAYTGFSVALTLTMYSVIENTYMPLIITYVSKGIENFFSSSIHIIALCSLPYRLAQIATILLLNRTNIVYILSTICRRFSKSLTIILLGFIFVNYYLSYLFSLYFDKFQPVHQISFAIALFILMIVFAVLIAKFINIGIRGVVINGYKQYRELEENSKYAFIELLRLLKDNDKAQAIEILEELTRPEKREKEVEI